MYVSPFLRLIADHGTQFRKKFHAAMTRQNIHHVRSRVRTPYLNGKVERAFRTFKLWWRVILCGMNHAQIQRRLNDYQHWYNHHRPHSAIEGRTPDEVWNGVVTYRPKTNSPTGYDQTTN